MEVFASSARARALAAVALSLGALTVSPAALGQVNPEIASCSELKDEATITQADLCSAHIGCRFVLNVQKTCARAKSYLERLQTAIGEGTKTLFGYRKEVTPDAVFTAALGAEELEKQRQLAGNTRAQQRAQEIGTRVREVGRGDEYSGKFGNGSTYIYYGQLKDGIPDGVGTRIASNGEIQRGQFDGNLRGSAEILFPDGTRFVGDQRSGERTGLEVNRAGRVDDGTYNSSTETFTGSRTYPDGTRFQGRFDKSQRTEGKFYRADGSLAEEGKYQNGQLSVGATYDTAGTRTEVNLPREREMAAQAEQQRKRELAAQAEQQFRASLQTLNPGQLFAKADELNAQGDRTRAREVQRVLMSRFPDHPLTATVARQMAGESGGAQQASGSPAPAGAGAGPGKPAGGKLSAQSCASMRQAVMTTRIPPNASVTASQETVMFMTKTVLDMIAGGCPTDGTTPAQIEAERAERQRQYTAAENACNQVQSGGRRCVPQAHSAR